MVVISAPSFHHGERQTRVDAPPLHQDCTRAALAMVAAVLGAGEMEVFPERVQ